MRRRTFVQLLSLPFLAALWPRAKSVQAQTQTFSGLVLTDSVGTPDLSSLIDGDPTTGIEYLP